jgi:D-hexose-6-phosphate mutarotase
MQYINPGHTMLFFKIKKYVIYFTNVSDSKAFNFTTLMHTYLRCSDIADVKIQGLEGLQYNDKVRLVRISGVGGKCMY